MFKIKARMKVPTLLRRFVPFADESVISESRKHPKKILLVKHSERLGNIVLMNSAISGLKNEFPDSEIDLVLPGKFAELMAEDNRISEVIEIHKKKYIYNPFKLLSLLRSLKRKAYDIAIDCSDLVSHSSTGIAYTILSGARATAGWNCGDKKLFDIEISRYSDTVHASHMYLRLFSGIFQRGFQGEPYFDMGFPEYRGREIRVGINCGGRGVKRWPIDNFLELGRRLSASGFSAEYILGPDEIKLRDYIKSNLPSGGRLIPPVNVKELRKTIADQSLFISSDTGPMHLAWALRIPVIAIFLSSEIEKFKPLSPGSKAIDGSDGVTPERICDEALKIINSKRVRV